MQRIAFSFLVAALLAGCSSPRPPAPVHPAQIVQPVQATDPCARYIDPTTHARCQLYTGADAWQFIPDAGRAADLDTQLRCAPLRLNPQPYARCIFSSTAETTRTITLPGVVAPTEPIAGYRGPSAEAEQPPPTKAVAMPAPAVGPAVDKTRTAVTSPAVRSWPYCAENDSCYGDIRSYTGRPKTVHVRGYYRKDGTYVRSHYRSRPRR